MDDRRHRGLRAGVLRAVEARYVVEIGPRIHMDGFPAAIVRTECPKQHREEELKAMDFRS